MRVKGTSLISFLAFLAKAHGEASRAAVVAALSEADRATLTEGPLASSWYDAGVLLRLVEGAKARLAPADAGFFRESGRFNADYGLLGPHRAMLRQGGPLKLLEAGTVLWRQFTNEGRMEVEGTGPTSAVMRIHGFAVSSVLCERTTGYCERATELAGGREVQVRKVRCGVKGDAYCEWTIGWS